MMATTTESRSKLSIIIIPTTYMNSHTNRAISLKWCWKLEWQRLILFTSCRLFWQTPLLFPQKGPSSSRLSSLSAYFLSISLPVDCFFVFRTQNWVFLLFIRSSSTEGLLSIWIPLPNPFVQVSFLSVIRVNHDAFPVIVLKCRWHVSPK